MGRGYRSSPWSEPGWRPTPTGMTDPSRPRSRGQPARTGPGDQDEGADEMTDYNRYLALLAVRGKPKTWRNPRGL